MEKNNPVKVKLSTAITLIIIATIIIISIVFAFISKNNKNIEESNSTKVISENAETLNTKLNDSDFSFNFLKMENNKENVVYSPLSIKYALIMLNEGAHGNTKAQIQNVLKNSTLVKYNNIEDVLSLANSLYIRDSFSNNVKKDFTDTLQNNYNAEIKYDAFQNADNINSWIENKTFKQIKNMLNDNLVCNPDTKMILINALAIDMGWKGEFDTSDTYGEKFYLNDNTDMIATMMHKTTKNNNFSYYKDDSVTALTMDLKEYENTQMEFMAIMPNNDLSNYINNFSTTNLEKITQNLKNASDTKAGLNITIPKFSFDYNLKLQEDLENLGITDAFNQKLADFSKISNDKLFVSSALHKANIDFTEKGVKAAAVTTFSIDSMSIAPSEIVKPIEIKIDKPFIYLIRDKETNEIWFVGTVYEPNSWENDKSDYLG